MRLFRFATQVLPLPALLYLSGCSSQSVVKPLPPLAPVTENTPARGEASVRPTDTAGSESAPAAGLEEQNLGAPQAQPGALSGANATGQAVGQPGTEGLPPAPSGGAPASSAGRSGPNGAPPSSALISEISDFRTVSELSNHSLDPLIDDALPAARAASMRTVEQAREQLEAKDSNSAFQLLSQAVSIDPSNPFAYFYLGRVYLARRDATEALTFLRHAELGFSDNPQWLAETQAFEGAAYELAGNTEKAQEAYRRALDASPGNYLAQVGYARVATADLRGTPDASVGGPANLSAPREGAPVAGGAPRRSASRNEVEAPEEPAIQPGESGAQSAGGQVPDDPAAPSNESVSGAESGKNGPEAADAPDTPASPAEPALVPPSTPSDN